MHRRLFVRDLQNWLDARERVGDSLLRDFNGMPYVVPVGMVSTQVRVRNEEDSTLVLTDIIGVPVDFLSYLRVAFCRAV